MLVYQQSHSILEKFAILYLTGIPEGQYDVVCESLFEDGAQGVSETLKFIQESQQYDPEIIPQDKKSIEAYFLPENLDIDKLSLSYEAYAPNLVHEEARDWLSEWKKHYKPFQVIGDLWIYPSWIEIEDKSRKVIKIDPGLAFGTGTHATTLLCMRKIEELSIKGSFSKGSVLDVGAGTGILSLLCYLNGFTDIVAVEIDDMAREKCRENFEINSFTSGKVLSDKEVDYNKEYDLVVANIIDGVLLTLKEDLVGSTKKDLILSGILKENEMKVKEEFLAQGLELISSHYLEEWCLLHFRK